jgi:UDP-N-acetylmuramoyl-tripeptide--D-alanyl-D-alanine ligase
VDVWHGLTGSSTGCPAALSAEAVTSVTIDSREAAPGALFVALPGERTDGHAYLGDAFERGARAAIAGSQARDLNLNANLVDEDGNLTPAPKTSDRTIFVCSDSLTGLQRLAAFWRTQMPAVAVGITGSVGKTTTKEIVANVLAQRYRVLRSEGNLNNEIGLPLTLLRLTLEHERVVLEMGMYALGEISQLCQLAQPRIGVVTNVGPTHLERLGTIERIAEAKAELVRALPSAEDGGVAIINADDPRVRAMAGLTRARVLTYGLNEAADLRADLIESDGLDGIRFHLHVGSEAFHLHLPMLGRHSVHTALRAAAVGLVDGLTWPEIIHGLEQVRGQLRLMVAPGLRDTLLIDDTYNASPESMLAALNLLEDIVRQKGEPSSRAIAVLGDMLELGIYEERGHRLVGGRAAQVVDAGAEGKLVTVGPRARWIADEALAAGMSAADIHVVETNRDAIAVLQGLVRPGDVILIKGSRTAGLEAIADALSRRPREFAPGARQGKEG